MPEELCSSPLQPIPYLTGGTVWLLSLVGAQPPRHSPLCSHWPPLLRPAALDLSYWAPALTLFFLNLGLRLILPSGALGPHVSISFWDLSLSCTGHNLPHSGHWLSPSLGNAGSFFSLLLPVQIMSYRTKKMAGSHLNPMHPTPGTLMLDPQKYAVTFKEAAVQHPPHPPPPSK